MRENMPACRDCALLLFDKGVDVILYFAGR